MIRVYDFECKKGHLNEKFISDEVKTIPCPDCGKPSHRKIAAPKCALDIVSGDFPGATMKWERQRKEKAKQTRQKES